MGREETGKLGPLALSIHHAVFLRFVAGRLAYMFLLCSHSPMSRNEENHVALAILDAPGWARLGITAPAAHLREDAAHELARFILAELAAGPRAGSEGDQMGLSL